MHDDLENSAGVRPGEVLAGKYRVERVLGVGGMGVVVAATHLQLEERVAIKFLLPEMLRNPEVVGRFAREARAAVKIKNEHVARVSDVGTLDGGAPYMVMEFLEGEDLAAWLQQRGPLPIEQAIDFVLQACVAVADAHGLGIVHRDLKPANLFCIRRSDGQFVIKVLDFGISKVAELGGSRPGMEATKTTAIMGSPLYMSPEQMRSAKDVDAQTDIWALGIVLYELLTGTPPFVGDSFAEVAIGVATGSFAPVRSFRPDAPPGLEAVILKSLEKEKGRRYGNVAELALALADFGPKRSRHSIERIVGIIQASGLSKSALVLPPSSEVPRPPAAAARISRSHEAAMHPDPRLYGSLGTMAPSANTAPEIPGVRKGRTAVAVASIVGVLAIAAGATWTLRLKSEASGAGASSATTPPDIAAAAMPAKPVVLEPQQPMETPVSPGAAAANGTLPAGTSRPRSVIPGSAAAHTEPNRVATPAPKASGAETANAAKTTEPASPPTAPAAHSPPPAPTCHITTEYDSAGQPHFKKVCN
jgi:eukaryotic-like serine/threonine-protein kinase